MRVGVPREIKPSEYRVGLTPSAVREYAHRGHEVLVETGAGIGAGYGDALYERAGAKIAPNARAVFEGSDLIVKVKEPQRPEWECWSRATSSSPICTWRPTWRRPRGW